MTSHQTLLNALDCIAPAYLDEAAPGVNTISRARHPARALLAACLGVAVLASGFLLLRSRMPGSDQASPAPNEPSAVQQDDVKEGPDARSDPADSSVAEAILSIRLGSLYLGMPQSEVEAICGEPTARSNTGPMTYEDGIQRETRNYQPTDAEPGVNEFTINYANAGDGWVVDGIYLWSDCGMALPHNIQIGMTEQELLTAWPELADEFVVERTPAEPDQFAYTSYRLTTGHLNFVIDLENGIVYAIALSSYYPFPAIDTDDAPEPEPYSFSSGEITVWHRTASGWVSVTAEGKQAKQLETIFSIEELTPSDCPTGPRAYAVDFHNGTVALVFDADESGQVCRLDDRAAFETSMESGSLPEGLTVLETCCFPAGVWAQLQELLP